MSSEEVEKAIEFLVKQQADWQAKHDAHLAQMDALAATHSRQIATLNEAMVAAFTAIEKLTVRMDQLTVRMDQLTEKQAETEARLNAFIVVVEKYISGNGNGHRPKRHRKR